MKWILLFVLTLLTLESKAQSDYPGVYYEANDHTYHQYADPGPAFYKHSLHSTHFDVFYGTGYGNTAPDKLPAFDPMFVDVQDLLNKAEWFFDNYVNLLKFTEYSRSKLSQFRMASLPSDSRLIRPSTSSITPGWQSTTSAYII